MTPDEELQVFKLISTAGTAKSAYMEAIKHAKDGRADESPASLQMAMQTFWKATTFIWK